MIMSPSLRKLILSVHLVASVGWIGAAAAYLALAVAALNSQNMQTLRAAWVAMEIIGWFAIVPLSIVALLTGLVMSLGTKWGLFRHYWVLFSLGLTVFANVVLVLHMQTVSVLARTATEMESGDIGMLRAGLSSELFHAGVGLLLLLVVQVLNVYKPRGVTPYGWRKQQDQRILSRGADRPT